MEGKDILAEIVAKAKGVEAESAAMATLFNEIEPFKTKILSESEKNWAVADEAALTLLGNGRCYEQYLANTSSGRLQLAFELLSISNRTASHTERVKKLSSMLVTHGGSECELVLLAQISKHFEQQHIEVDLSAILPSILRALATIIQRYLTSKQDKVNNSQDRVEVDLQLHKHCEEWVSTLLERVVRAISKYSIGKYPNRKYFLNFCCDAIEALLRNILDHTMNEQILSRTLKTVVDTLQEAYSLAEVVDEQARLLQQAQTFGSPPNQLQVPECYPLAAEFNRSGAAYLISKYLELPSTRKFYSRFVLSKAVVLATSESITSSYPFRIQLLKTLADFVSDKTADFFRSNFELGYPLSVLIERLLTASWEESANKSIFDSILESLLKPSIAALMLQTNHHNSAKLLLHWLKANPSNLAGFKKIIGRIEKQKLGQPQQQLLDSFLKQ